MKSSGNGTVETCCGNLLRIVRGENPFERVKGVDPRSYDKPADTARFELETEAQWVLNTYEPRATINSITTVQDDGISGDFRIVADIKNSE